MPIIKTVNGDLLKMFKEREFDMIVHGCNCFHTMGAGIAGKISEQFPYAYKVDKLNSAYSDRNKLGHYTVATIPDCGVIVNAYTQYHPGRENPISLAENIEKVFSSLAVAAQYVYGPGAKVGIPKIGCGIAGGDWGVIEGIINDSSPGLSIVVVEYSGK